MKKKIYFFLISGLILLVLVLPSGLAPQTSLGIFKQNDCVNLIQLCADCTYNNITSIIYPNSTIEIIDAEMTKRGTEYNYSFCNTEQLEKYLVNGVGDLSGVDTIWAYDLIITPTGNQQTISQGIGSAVFLFLMLALTFLFGYIGFRFLDSDYLWVLGVFFLFLTVLFIVYDVWLGYEYHKNWTGIDDGSVMPEIIFYLFIFTLVSGLAVSGILLFSKWKKVKEWYERGREEQEREDAEDARAWR